MKAGEKEEGGSYLAGAHEGDDAGEDGGSGEMHVCGELMLCRMRSSGCGNLLILVVAMRSLIELDA